MKEMFSIKGKFKGNDAILTWDDSNIYGTSEALEEYCKISKEFSGKKSFGLMPDVSFSDYHLNPLAAREIFFSILENAKVVTGKKFYDEILGANSPPDSVF